MSDQKKPRVFVENPESGFGLMYCGTVDDPELHKGIGHIVEGMLADVAAGGATDLTFHVKLMTDAEVESLPDL